MKTHRAQLIAALLLSAALFAALAILRATPFFVALDHAASAKIAALRFDTLTVIVASLTEILSVQFMIVAFGGFVLALWWGGEKRQAADFLLSIVLGVLFFVIAKAIGHVARPDGGLLDVAGSSFPSGHATIATIFFIFLSHLFEETRPRRVFLFLFNLLALCMILAVCFSRIYLGVHWLSDVAGGMLVGVFSTSAARLAMHDYRSRSRTSRSASRRAA